MTGTIVLQKSGATGTGGATGDRAARRGPGGSGRGAGGVTGTGGTTERRRPRRRGRRDGQRRPGRQRWHDRHRRHDGRRRHERRRRLRSHGGAVRHLRERGQPLRRRAQHRESALRSLQRKAVPGPQHGRDDQGHPHPDARRFRRRRLARRVLFGNDVRHHRGLRPIGQGERPLVPGIDHGARLDVEQPFEGDQRVADAQRSQGLLALHQPGQQLLGRRLEVGHRARQSAGRHVHGDERQALQQRLLLRLRQQRDRSEGRRSGRHGRPQLQRDHGLGNRGRVRSLGDGRSRVRGLRREQHEQEPERPDADEHLRHRGAEEQRDDGVRAQGRRRDVRCASGPTTRAVSPEAGAR